MDNFRADKPKSQPKQKAPQKKVLSKRFKDRIRKERSDGAAKRSEASRYFDYPVCEQKSDGG